MIILNKKLLAVLAVILVAAGIIGANYTLKKSDESSSPQFQGSDDTAGAVTKEGSVKELSPFLGGPASKLPPYTGRPLGEVRFGVGLSVPQSSIDKNSRNLATLASVLNQNPMGREGVNDWIALGVIKKFFNDYEGARDAWEYAGVLYPANALSFANLGNLYGFYLNDHAKAELNFRKAIANDPYQPGYYVALADFYKTVYVSKKSEAPKVLLEGISIIKEVNLVLALASYYRDVGDKANAVKYYEEVLKMAPEQAGIREEINKLSN